MDDPIFVFHTPLNMDTISLNITSIVLLSIISIVLLLNLLFPVTGRSENGNSFRLTDGSLEGVSHRRRTVSVVSCSEPEV